MKTIIKSMLFALPFFCFTAFAQQELQVVVDGRNVVTVKKDQRVLSKVIKYTSGYIAELQETLSISKRLGKNLGVRVGNSRRLFPMSNGDFIVTDETKLSLNLHARALERLVGDFNVGLAINGAATPSVRRFFVSSVGDSRQQKDYSEVPGPYNTRALVGIDDGLYDIGKGIKVDSLRYARYNKWTQRFYRNIKDFPLSINKADDMAIGEGYSYVFEGVVGLGPSVTYSSPISPHLTASANFKYSKNIKSGRFEIIVIKIGREDSPRLLVSIRQARTVGDNFNLSWGGKISSSIEALIGTNVPLISDNLTVLSVSRSRSNKTEQRFNATYEVDLLNTSNRAIYDSAFSNFDFSWFDLFTFGDIANSSKIIGKFQGGDVKLVLETESLAEVDARAFRVKNLIFEFSRNKSRETYTGTAKYSKRRVETAGGTITREVINKFLGNGRKRSLFEFKAYEEFGKQARTQKGDIVLIARKVLLDEKTQNTSAENGDAVTKTELENHVAEFNNFLPRGKKIIFNPRKDKNLYTTYGIMEFFITRGDILALQRYPESKLKEKILNLFPGWMPKGKRRYNRFLKTDTAKWKLGPGGKVAIGNRFKSGKEFILGFRQLKASIKSGQRLESVAAINRMLTTRNQHLSLYASLFRAMLIELRVTPKINVKFYNSTAQINFNEIEYKTAGFVREGLQLAQELDRATSGVGYYESIHRDFLRVRQTKRDGSLLRVKFYTREGQSPFRGFIRVVFKQTQSGESVTSDRGELIFDLKNFRGSELVLNLNGNSEAEKIMSQFEQNSDKIFMALSFDNKIYDDEIELEYKNTNNSVEQERR